MNKKWPLGKPRTAAQHASRSDYKRGDPLGQDHAGIHFTDEAVYGKCYERPSWENLLLGAAETKEQFEVVRNDLNRRPSWMREGMIK